MPLPLTIDTHAHYFPESYMKLVASRGEQAAFRDPTENDTSIGLC